MNETQNDSETETAVKTLTFLRELNTEWLRVFGHTYNECYQMSLLGGEIGAVHEGHINFVSNRVSPTEDEVGE